MNKLITIGEFLIDFTANGVGALKSIRAFTKNPGGAPANVAITNQRLGGKSLFITKLGNDSFGDFLFDILKEAGIDTSLVFRSNDYQTSLAFVALKADGNRDFTFYRSNASDLNITPEEIDETIFKKHDILHFCSVDLVESKTKYAHDKAIAYAMKHDLIISFDPNLRFPLWKDPQALKTTVLSYLSKADIIKISDDELSFLTDSKNENKAIKHLFKERTKLVLLTKGSKGATLYSRVGQVISLPSVAKRVVDTTGAGDAFIGAFLNQLLKNHITTQTLLNPTTDLTSFLAFANKVAAKVCETYGAIPSIPTLKDLEND